VQSVADLRRCGNGPGHVVPGRHPLCRFL
jgi:hypothetical protein